MHYTSFMSRTRLTHTGKHLLSALLLGLCFLLGSLTQAQAPPEDPPPPGETSHPLPHELLQQQLVETHGYDASWFEQSEAAQQIDLAIHRAAQQARIQTPDTSRDELLMLRGATQFLSSELATPRLKKKRRQALATQLAQNLATQTTIKASQLARELDIDAHAEHLSKLERFLTTQRAHNEELAAEQAREAKQAEEERLEEERKRLEAMNLKRKAEADLEKIKDRQRQATTQQIKELLNTQAELAERVIKLTSERPEVEKELTRISELDLKSFNQTKDELDLFIEQLPSDDTPLKASKQETVNKLFDALRLQQRKARKDFLDTRALEHELRAELITATSRQEEDQEKLEQARQAYEESKSELGEARLELATTRAKLSRLEAELISLRLEEATARHRRLDEELSYFHKSKERLIEVLSPEKRAAFYSLTNDQNWSDARLGAQLALVRFAEHAVLRFDMFIDVISNPFSISLWSWIGAFIVRLFLVFGAVYIVTQRGPALLKRLMSALLKRPFFRKYPTVTLKSGEVLDYLLRPTTIFLGWTYMIGFGQQVLPELRFVQWFINAIFIFRTLTIVISVVILPRTVREPHKLVERDDTTTWGGQEGATAEDSAHVDLFALEISRARKLVTSGRVITLFWLLVIYMPALTIELLGHTVIWRIVDIATTWGFILVIYSVLSTWRDEIARLFEKLAIDRLPRAVHFVNQNKDRIWGVLVIGGASLYVIGSESLRLGKRYLIETQWSKQINNFIFRKQIEYKQRDRDKQEDDVAVQMSFQNLPTHYVDFFEDRPLSDEVYRVESNADIHDQIVAYFSSWCAVPNQGSIALHGEVGMGRSTLLFELAESLGEPCEECQAQIVYTRLIERCVTQPEILEYIANLFGIEEAPGSRTELVDLINALPMHVLLIDDCQRLFLRKIGGFNGLETFLQVVNLTDAHHFWVLTFERFSWSYLARIKQRAHYFGKVLDLVPWTETEIQDLIWKRNLMTGMTTNFTDLVVTREDGDEDVSFEVIKSAQGYFRLLHDFSKGNPRVAMIYWLRSIKPNTDDEQVLDVGLFRSPPQRALAALQDNYWFTLTAIAQHGALNAHEIASIINADEGFCEMALNYFQEKHIITLDSRRRAKLTPVYLRQILRQLTVSNYLYD